MYPMPRAKKPSGLSRAEILARARAARANALKPDEATDFVHLRADAAALSWFTELEPKARQAVIEAAYKRAKREPRPKQA